MTDEVRASILAGYPFALDRFQIEAIDAVDHGDHVIVAAPTGSGKTVIAEYAIEVAVRRGRRAFYTAPIKALSNQKYHDLSERHGDVGLLTGDVAINGDADVVVMTTEVLRNMIYAGRDLAEVGVVVLDEVHFLQDAYRGPVWEEVIIHLPEHVRLVCLSATVSNADDLGAWIETVRGPTTVVVEQRRPVELDQFLFVADRTNHRLRFMPTLVDGRPNPDALRLDALRARPPGRRERAERGRSVGGERILATPARADAITALLQRDLLPAIYFIFSRAQCDAAASEIAQAGLGLGNPSRRDRLHEIAADRLHGLAAEDLAVLGFDRFMELLEAGVAAHHAGLVPPFKEVVEQAFVEGLLAVVFATETLAVGVNMPARSVVIEKLSKYTGDGHELLSPAQFTQLTGRAGRRGIDARGAAVVLWNPFVRFDQVAELALSRSFHLRSAFRPTYNMAANLVRRYEPARARQLLSLSFAQHQVDRDIVKIERRLERQSARLAELEAIAVSPFGDLDDYRRTRASGPSELGPIDESLAALRPGSVIHASKGKHFGPVAVVATAHRAGGLKVTAVTPSGHALHLTAADFARPVVPIGRIALPGNYSPHRTEYRKEVGRRVRRTKLRRPAPDATRQAHPVETDPDLSDRLAAAAEADRVRREIDRLEHQGDRRTASLAREFDAVLEILAARGYVDLERWVLTEAGDRLSNLFHESDLLVAEVIGSGLLAGLDPPAMAGMVSVFVYEHRSPEDPPRPWFPDAEVRRRWTEIETMSTRLARDERALGLTEHRPPDPGFFAVAYAWCAGETFADLIAEEDLTGGDFVRTAKQLVDLLGQVASVGPAEVASTARRAGESTRRGVVADSSTVGR